MDPTPRASGPFFVQGEKGENHARHHLDPQPGGGSELERGTGRSRREAAFVSAKNGAGFRLTTTIDRFDFGVSYESKLPNGMSVLGHQVDLVGDIEAVNVKESSQPEAEQKDGQQARHHKSHHRSPHTGSGSG